MKVGIDSKYNRSRILSRINKFKNTSYRKNYFMFLEYFLFN